MILHFLEEFACQLQGQRVLVWCDNSTAVRSINKGSLQLNVIVGIVRQVRLLCLKYDIWLWLAHIPGVLNIEATHCSGGSCLPGFRIRA